MTKDNNKSKGKHEHKNEKTKTKQKRIKTSHDTTIANKTQNLKMSKISSKTLQQQAHTKC